MAKLRKGDTVQVITGKDAGKSGTITHVITDTGRITVEGVNVAKKHRKPRSQEDPGGIMDRDMPLDASNVMLLCKKCDRPVRVGFEIKDGEKIRVCSRCGKEV